MSLAEQIATFDHREQIKVIAGEGTKRYYEKLGYREGTYGYMVKWVKSY